MDWSVAKIVRLNDSKAFALGVFLSGLVLFKTMNFP